ncbi:MAG: 50S ribosomal protein L22 [Deltaproteobacteria bacterium]|nr:50S ribosomal protein L22 [Deltaproteobacteria bacterium]
MEARAKARYVRGGAQKAGLVMALIRGKKIEDALTALKFCDKAAARDVEKVLKSAVANAENTKKLDVDELYVKNATADYGPFLKRTHAKAMGRGAMIKKRMSHLTVVLVERKKGR